MEPTKFMGAVAVMENKGKMVIAEDEYARTITMPIYSYEREQAFKERTIKRQGIAIAVVSIVAIIAIFLTAYLIDKGWRDYFSECDITSYDYSQDGEGINIVGDSNGVDFVNGTKGED